MTFRKRIKHWLYGSCPGFRGSFRYFNARVFFPPNSLSFRAACEQGVFEHDNLRLLTSLARPNSWMFDIGTNIGLMAVPVLAHEPLVHVLSLEPSPNTLPSLQRTMAVNLYADRWFLVPKAVGAKAGSVKFHLATAENSLFDSLRDTGRVPSAASVNVEMTTVDAEWVRLGKPPVSMIKCDIEGGELAMLEGAHHCISSCLPAFLLEWNAQNLAAFQIAPESLLEFAKMNDYSVHPVPGLSEIRTARALGAHMTFTESFLLLPTR